MLTLNIGGPKGESPLDGYRCSSGGSGEKGIEMDAGMTTILPKG